MLKKKHGKILIELFWFQRVITDEYYLGYYDRNKQEPDYFKNNENQMIPNVNWEY